MLEEARRGEEVQSRQRLDLLADFKVLRQTAEVEHLARLYLQELALPPRAYGDAAHLAFACAYEIELEE